MRPNTEIYKPIKGFEMYSISKTGKIYSGYTGKILKSHFKRYEYVHLCQNKIPITKTVHRLVAETWMLNENNFLEINHIDNNPRNNHVSNLEWCTRSHNVKQTFVFGRENTAKHTRKKVIQLDKQMNKIKIWDSMTEVQTKLKIKVQGISFCCKNITKTAGGYYWRLNMEK